MSVAMIQVDHVDGQCSIGLSMSQSEYIVSYGLDVKTFPRTINGLSNAVRCYESCLAHAWVCASDCTDDHLPNWEE